MASHGNARVRSTAARRRRSVTPGTVYRRLFAFHGPQGWWPIVNPETGSSEYHVGAPRSADDFFEIAIGAILTQNISWKNVDTALAALKNQGLMEPGAVMRARHSRLARLIRSTGYFNQKTIKIREFTRWYEGRGGDWRPLLKMNPEELRTELLSIHGIGPETADSILLYGLGIRTFVVDAYTVRLFARLGLLTGKESYHQVREMFHRRFRGTAAECNEYHALIVAHGKDYCMKKPRCERCCLSPLCPGIGTVGGDDRD